MPNPQNIKGKGFDKNPGHINKKGRPKTVANAIKDLFLQDYHFKLSNSQANEIIQGLLGKTKDELVELANNKEVPFWITLIAKKAQMDFNAGSIELLEKLFDRVYGKPKQEFGLLDDTDVTIKITNKKKGSAKSNAPAACRSAFNLNKT